ncbi:MAG: FAD-dependent monooxygenase [Alphaproteobacteria bacterium]
MSQTPSKVAIVGGGIGGLFAANALIAHGLDVSVYEQAPELGEVGAGFYVTPNSVRQLQRVGLGPSVEKWGALVGEGSQYLRHDGSHIAPVQVEDASGWNATYGMHRADMIDLLAAGLPESVVHCGHQGVAFEQDDDTARVTFANGNMIEADVVVAADGIHSELRPFVYPPSTPVFHGTISYRGLVSRERLPDWPMDRWQMWAGPEKHFLVFPVRHGEMINYVGFVPTDEEMKESWSAPGDPDTLRAEFKGWDPQIEAVLEQVDHTFRWALYDREPLPTWTNGRLTLLGDAAHPMLPHLGQGANQAMEDGMALAIILSKTDKVSVPAALQAYEKLRRERVAEIVLGARQNGLRVDSMSDYTDLDKRDAELAAHAEFRKHLYAYDVVPDAEAAAAAI